MSLTKTAIRKLPTNLPHARIYLDDLFEIENLLVEEFAKLPSAPSISFEYAIDRTVAMTTHEELIEHGGDVTHFWLSITSTSGFLCTGSLMIDGAGRPIFQVPYQLRNNEWAIFGKVEQIFKAREDKLKNFNESIPVSLIFWFWLIVIAVGMALSAATAQPNHVMQPFQVSGLVVEGVFVAFLSALIIGQHRKNRIYLQPVRQDQRARTAIRKERIEKLLWLLLGTVAGTLGTIFVERLKH